MCDPHRVAQLFFIKKVQAIIVDVRRFMELAGEYRFRARAFRVPMRRLEIENILDESNLSYTSRFQHPFDQVGDHNTQDTDKHAQRSLQLRYLQHNMIGSNRELQRRTLPNDEIPNLLLKWLQPWQLERRIFPAWNVHHQTYQRDNHPTTTLAVSAAN